jgi:hypothetical protein
MKKCKKMETIKKLNLQRTNKKRLIELTQKQENFAQAVADGEFDYPWQAYDKYYDTKKMSKNALYVETCRLLQHPKVSLRICELRNQNRTRNEVKLDEVLENLAKYLRFNIKSIVNSNGTLKGFDEMTDDEAACIASFESYETIKNGEVVGVLRKVKLIDKLLTADKFLRNMGAYINNRNHHFDKENLDHLKEIIDSIE